MPTIADDSPRFNYTVWTPDGQKIERTSKHVYTHALVRKFEDGGDYKVSLAGDYQKAKNELTNRKAPEHALILKLDTFKSADSRNKRYQLLEVTNQPPKFELAEAPEPVDAEAIWAAAFQAGKDYALQCAFQGVTDQPANPYAA